MSIILLVEDDTELRSLMAALLERDGHGVLHAANGSEALEILRRMRPALVFLDLMMPVMSGPELLEVMAADDELAQVPVVVVSALAGEGGALGVKKFLRKPVSVKDLREAVDAYASAA